MTSSTDPNGNITYTVYDDADHETRVYAGWHSIGNGQYTSTGPIQVTRQDWAANYTETLTYAATLSQAVPDGSDPIQDLQTLDRQYMNDAGQTVEDRRYFNLSGITYSPTPDLGTVNVNYYRTTYGYDDYGRQNEVVAPTGTITKNVYDTQDRLTETLVGTSESNLTDVADYQYDNGGSGDGDLTQTTLHPGGGVADRVTSDAYDWRDRLVAETDGAGTTAAQIGYTSYDNWNLPTSVAMYAGNGVTLGNTDGVPDAPDASKLRSLETFAYDEQQRVYQDTVFSVNSITGDVGDGETTNTYYDGRGDVVATESPSGVWTKDTYDGADRPTSESITDGAGGSTLADAESVAGDHVLSQTRNLYDGEGNVTETIESDRLATDNDAATGALGDAAGNGGPAARVSTTANYYDAADRLTESADLGTNGSSFTYDAANPPATSPTALTTEYGYNSAGWVNMMIDARGIETRYRYDNAGRTTETIADYTTVNGVGGTPTNDSNQMTDYTYDGDGHTTSMTAVMPAGTPNQTTKYVYGVNTAIDSNDLLATVEYPDLTTGNASTSSANDESYTYNALGQKTSYTDRNGDVHDYSYDVLGRRTSDTVATLGAGVDGSVMRIDTAYDSQGLPYLYTSYGDIAGTNVVNQVEDVYNGLGQLATEYQANNGAVDTSSTPQVTCGYSSPAAGSRPTSITYPDGRTIDDNYATGVDDAIGRLSSLSDASGTLEAYSYLGLSTLVGQTQGNGVIESTTLDNFGRVAEMSYVNGSGVATDDFQYGYDRDGNVLYKDNVVDPSLSELYSYDNLNRITSDQEGTLAGGDQAIVGTPTDSQSWTYDALGNQLAVTTNGTTVGNVANGQNELTASGSSGLAYDDNGNTTTDENGNTLSYNAWNQLISVKNSSGATIASYTYDAKGNRITQTEDPAGGSGPAVTTDFYLSNEGQVIEERQGSTVTAQNVWNADYVNDLLQRTQGGTTYYAQHDANFDVTAMTDTGGNVLERYTYQAYGAVTVRNADGSVEGDGTMASSNVGSPYLFRAGEST